MTMIAGRRKRAAVPPRSWLVRYFIQPFAGRASSAATKSAVKATAVVNAIPENEETSYSASTS